MLSFYESTEEVSRCLAFAVDAAAPGCADMSGWAARSLKGTRETIGGGQAGVL